GAPRVSSPVCVSWFLRDFRNRHAHRTGHARSAVLRGSGRRAAGVIRLAWRDGEAGLPLPAAADRDATRAWGDAIGETHGQTNGAPRETSNEMAGGVIP